MTIKELSKDLQEILKDGIMYVTIYKKGSTWCYEILYNYDPNNSEDNESIEDIKRYEEIKETIDKNTLLLNGYYDFGNYSLKYIEWHIKRLYEKESKDVK